MYLLEIIVVYCTQNEFSINQNLKNARFKHKQRVCMLKKSPSTSIGTGLDSSYTQINEAR